MRKTLLLSSFFFDFSLELGNATPILFLLIIFEFLESDKIKPLRYDKCYILQIVSSRKNKFKKSISNTQQHVEYLKYFM